MLNRGFGLETAEYCNMLSDKLKFRNLHRKLYEWILQYLVNYIFSE